MLEGSVGQRPTRALQMARCSMGALQWSNLALIRGQDGGRVCSRPMQAIQPPSRLAAL